MPACSQADPNVAPVLAHVTGVTGAGIEVKFQLQVKKGQLASEEAGTVRRSGIVMSTRGAAATRRNEMTVPRSCNLSFDGSRL